jgi:hypothetical protein
MRSAIELAIDLAVKRHHRQEQQAPRPSSTERQ